MQFTLLCLELGRLATSHHTLRVIRRRPGCELGGATGHYLRTLRTSGAAPRVDVSKSRRPTTSSEASDYLQRALDAAAAPLVVPTDGKTL